jgi:hypothetical protein
VLVWAWFSERRELVVMCRLRVRAVERAARAVMDENRHMDLGEMLRRRRQFWAHRFVHDFNLRACQRLYQFEPISKLIWISSCVSCLMVILRDAVVKDLSLPSTCGLNLLLWSLVGAWFARTRVLRQRCVRALGESKCPDCSYDLSMVPPEIPASNLGGVIVGPSRCVECGAPWPLVPAPIPSDARRMEQAWLEEPRP